MKGIETYRSVIDSSFARARSDHCPAMKGIETRRLRSAEQHAWARSDHCPAMKGIETGGDGAAAVTAAWEATTAPQ